MAPKKAQKTTGGGGKGKGKRKQPESDEDFELDAEEDAPVAAAAKKQPRKAARRGADAAAALPAGPELAELISKLPRAELEQLLISSVDNKQAIWIGAVEEILTPPAGKRELCLASPAKSDDRLAAEGPWNALTRELTLRIISGLNLRDRFSCLQVCKGWRSLREEPELWASVDTTGGRGSGTIMSEGGIMRLLAPKIDRLAVVPSKEAVKSIVISGGKLINAATYKAILKANPALTSLTISGKKVGTQTIGDIGRSGKNLTHLSVGETSNKVGATALLELFSTCPRLESVELPSESISSTSFVSVLRERVAAARSGGCSLVRKLSLEGISLGPLAQLGSAFPELEELTVGCVKSSGDQALRGWAPLPRLRAVRFKSLGSNGWGAKAPVESSFVNDLLSGLAGAAPSLRELTVLDVPGRSYSYRQTSDPTAAPRPSAGLAALCGLQKLESLSLTGIAVSPDACAAASLPSLTALRLTSCGAASAAAALAIATGAPKLRSLHLLGVPRADPATKAPLGPGIAAMLPLAARRTPQLQQLASAPVVAPPTTAAAAAAAGGSGSGSGASGSGSSPAAAAAAVVSAAATAPYAALEELVISYTGCSVVDDTGSVALPDTADTVSAVVRALARSGTCPRLAALSVHLPGSAPLPTANGTFLLDKAHRFPRLRVLSLGAAEGSVLEAFGILARNPAQAHAPAPQLTTLAAPPWINPGGVTRAAGVPPELSAAYAAVRARCPELPALASEAPAAPLPAAYVPPAKRPGGMFGRGFGIGLPADMLYEMQMEMEFGEGDSDGYITG